jgi:hypothetical protein
MDPVRSCRTALLRHLADELGCPCVLLVPGARRRTQYPTGEDVFPVVQPSPFMYVAGSGVPFYDAVCALHCQTPTTVSAQLLIPCSPSQRIFDGCTPTAFDGDVVDKLQLPAGWPVHYLRTGSDGTTDLSPWIDSATPLPGSAFPLCRSVKTTEEQECISQACTITGQALQRTVRHLRKRWRRGTAVTEAALAQAFRYYCTCGGGGEMSFPPIVASGAHAATLHHVPGESVIEPGRPVILDVGTRCCGYCADITVTVGCAERWKTVHGHVRSALRRLIASLRPGQMWAEVEAEGRRQMAQALQAAGLPPQKLPQLMPHSCGHHLGLDCHDQCGDEKLQVGAALALELGVYVNTEQAALLSLPAGGVRVEDNVILEAGGARNLTSAHVDRLRD